MGSIRRLLLLASLALLCLLSGCTSHGPTTTEELTAADIELVDTPFFPQEEYQCGPAALATLLVGAGVPITPDRLSGELYIPKRKGTLQLELIGAVRRHQRIPYPIRPEVEAIRAELQAGRPVLVLQNLGIRLLPVYHYAVVVGLLGDGQVVLRSGTTRRLVMPAKEFALSWERAGTWGIVAVKGGEMPADHDIARFIDAVSRVEAAGETELAEKGYRTALNRDPGNDPATFGLANTLFARGSYREAAALYRRLLARNPKQAEAANNLAEALAAQGCYREALKLLNGFLPPAAAGSDREGFLTATRTEIRSRFNKAGGVSAECSPAATASSQ